MFASVSIAGGLYSGRRAVVSRSTVDPAATTLVAPRSTLGAPGAERRDGRRGTRIAKGGGKPERKE